MRAIVASVVVAAGFVLGPPAEAAVTVSHYADGLKPNSRLGVITAGSDGNLWFTDPGANAIGRITPQGEITEFSEGVSPKAGTEPPGQEGPLDITPGPDGNLWFTEPGRDLVGRITTRGEITEFSQGISAGASPTGITAGPDGNLWFTERGKGTTPGQPGKGMIGRITPQGEITEFAQAVGASGGIAVGADGNLWYLAQGGIGRITPQGEATLFSLHEDTSVWLRGLTAGPDGNLWFTEALGTIGIVPRIGRLTPQRVLTEFGEGGPGTAFGISPGPDGNLWFTKDDLGVIGRITPQGEVSEFCHGMSRGAAPAAITAGPDGNLWFTEGNWFTETSRIGRVEIGASDAVERAPTSYLVFTGPRHVLGRACDDQAVTRVGVSVTRLSRTRSGPRCRALSRRGRWLRYRAVRSQCRPRFLLTARPRISWRLRLPRTLGKGRYTITSRATDPAGQRETVFSAELGNVRTLKLRETR